MTAVRLAAAATLSNTAGSRWSEELAVFSEVSGKEDRYKKELSCIAIEWKVHCLVHLVRRKQLSRERH